MSRASGFRGPLSYCLPGEWGGAMGHALKGIGYYRSPLGGAAEPYRVPVGMLLFELITDGAVYAPEDDDLRGAGWVFLHFPDQKTIWRTDAGGHYECLTVHFDLSIARDQPAWPRAYLWGNAGDAVEFAHEMLHAFHYAGLDREVLGHYVWSQFRYRLDLLRRSERKLEVPDRLAAVMRFVDLHYGEAIGIDALAAKVGLSASHLHALFREHVKMSPHQYVVRQRIRAARHLLAAGSRPVKAIAQDVGYANTESFCRAFRQHTGLTASAYRRQYQIY